MKLFTGFLFVSVIFSQALPIRINCGSTQTYTDSSGNIWSNDMEYNGGTPLITPVPIANTQDQTIYQSKRWGNNLNYKFLAPTGLYHITLKFAETLFTVPGKRIFNVTINGILVLNKFDQVAAAGAGNTAIDESFDIPVQNNSGIVISFMPVSGNAPEIHGIQIIPNTTNYTVPFQLQSLAYNPNFTWLQRECTLYACWTIPPTIWPAPNPPFANLVAIDPNYLYVSVLNSSGVIVWQRYSLVITP